jgi:hypothetical protein
LLAQLNIELTVTSANNAYCLMAPVATNVDACTTWRALQSISSSYNFKHASERNIWMGKM